MNNAHRDGDMDAATTTGRTGQAHPSKWRYWADKLAVESEPGLTSAQLMLTNYDLKPYVIRLSD
ncbi:hypothetical protein CTA2_1734 [Colletotrichum tanaceti]|nr:hypothetical protein CTA2_1734 [Colletotrichum tanaceti]